MVSALWRNKMDEMILSGYCRCIDGSRTVLVEIEDGKCYPDCAYGNCPHAQSCPIAQKIRECE